MTFDLVVRQARIAGQEHNVCDIGVRDGLIAEIAPHIAADAPEVMASGRLIAPGFVDSHIHLDKSCICDRCAGINGTVQDAIARVAAAKREFTEDDVFARGQRTLEKAITQGTMRMRTHVEVDPRVGLRSFAAVQRLKHEYAWAIDLEICVFPQEGLLNDPGTDELLVEACETGADLIGGCPYTDTDPHGHISRIFALASRFNLDIDFHLDFDLDPSWMHLDEVCRLTQSMGWGGRVAIGHVTKLSAVDNEKLRSIGLRLAESGVAVTVLPATDLYLMGREHAYNVPRGLTRAHRLLDFGVTCSLATNNVLNPFTPFGDCSLVRIANLYANAAHAGAPHELEACFDMITRHAARLMNLADYGIATGRPADLVVLDCASRSAAIAEIIPASLGIKRGRITFVREAAKLCRPDGSATVNLQGNG